MTIILVFFGVMVVTAVVFCGVAGGDDHPAGGRGGIAALGLAGQRHADPGGAAGTPWPVPVCSRHGCRSDQPGVGAASAGGAAMIWSDQPCRKRDDRCPVRAW